MATGTTNDFNYSRDEIITAAYRKVGALADDEVVTASMLQHGIKALNAIVRSFDLKQAHVWKVSNEPRVTFLSANTWRYTLSTTVLEVISATYRTAEGVDYPLDVLDAREWAAIPDKYVTGDPACVYIEPRRDITATPEMLIWPAPSTVGTYSVVTGTDGSTYACVKAHTSDSTNRPITGVNYLEYWAATGSGPSSWVTATGYTSAEQIRLVAKTPLADFDLATDNADLPSGFGNYLVYRLANDLADDYHLPLDERQRLQFQAKQYYEEVFPYQVAPASTSIHNKHRFI